MSVLKWGRGLLDDVIVVVRVGNGVRGGPEVETFVTDRCGRRR